MKAACKMLVQRQLETPVVLTVGVMTFIVSLIKSDQNQADKLTRALQKYLDLVKKDIKPQ